MASIKRGAPHGLWKVVAQLTGESGLSYGQAGSGLANGTTSQALVLDNPKSAGLPTIDPVEIDFTGGDRWITSFQYGINSLGSFDFTVADEDRDFNAMITGTLVDQTSNTEWTEFTYDELISVRPQVSLMFIFREQSTEAATFGQTYYRHTIIPRAWVTPRGTQAQYQTAGELGYRVKPTSSGRKITGEAFGANLGATDNRLAMYHIIAPNPLYMVIQRVNGTSATVVSAYKPISSAVGTANATKNKIVRLVESTGVATEGVADTITPATGTFAVGTALTVAAGDMLAILHETAYEKVA